MKIWVVLLALASTLRAVDSAGQVLDAQTGQPIARARVAIQIRQDGGEFADLFVSSDTSGTFRVTHVPKGSAQFNAQKAGYVGSNSSAVLSGDAESVPVALRLNRQAVISGRGVDENGAGLPF